MTDLPKDFHPNAALSSPPTSTILETPEQLFFFRLLQIKYALKIEIRTGLRHSRGSVLKLAQEVLIDHDRCTNRTKPRTKRDAFDMIDQWVGELTKDLTDDPA